MRRNDLFRKLSVDSITAGSGKKHGLKRSLGAFELMMLGVGVIIGSGLFVITGVAAAEHAGPALILSFVLAGLACACAALCYGELASAIPASGSSYTFVYVGLGEVFGWFIGWCITLEYVVAMSAIAVGWSAYAANILDLLGLDLPAKLLTDPFSGGVINIPAILIVSLMAALQLKGTKASARLNNILVFVKLAVILIFVILIAKSIDAENYEPFMPFGWSGVFPERQWCFCISGIRRHSEFGGGSEKSPEGHAPRHNRFSGDSNDALYNRHADADGCHKIY